VRARHLAAGLAAALVAAAFAASLARQARRVARHLDPGVVTIRIAHWQLEAGYREAMTELAADYGRLHPGVRVEQIAVPGPLLAQWRNTQLIGGDPPDLLESGAGVNVEQLARFFAPLTAWVEEPNPYNAGTELEGVPWRDTFVDGLSGSAGLATMQDYYGIPLSVGTVRLFYNAGLYREIMGDAPAPRTYAEFLEVCRRTREWAARRGRAVLPVAGSSFTANILLDQLFCSQTQRRGLELDRVATLRAPHPPALFLDPAFSLDDPAVRRGLELMREVGREMQSGFMAYDRDDAIFFFAQGRALTMTTGSWDYRSIATQAPFEIGLCELPLPAPGEGPHGAGVLGRPSDLAEGGGANYLVTAASRHPREAVDFLRFLTGRAAQEKLARISRFLPAVAGVDPAPEVAAFRPVAEGMPQGFRIARLKWGSGEVYRLFTTRFHVLVDPAGGVDAFLARLREGFPAAVRADAADAAKYHAQGVQRQDTTLAALGALQVRGRAELAAKRTAMFEAQNARELDAAVLALRQGRARP
jgi:raffinose/stachyose/melibiose transport system substrate-binding protein